MKKFKVAIDKASCLITCEALVEDFYIELEGTLDSRAAVYERARMLLTRLPEDWDKRPAWAAAPGGDVWNVMASLPGHVFDTLLLLTATQRIRSTLLTTTKVRYGKATVISIGFNAALTEDIESSLVAE